MSVYTQLRILIVLTLNSFITTTSGIAVRAWQNKLYNHFVLICLIQFNGVGKGSCKYWLDRKSRIYISRATYIEQYIHMPHLLYTMKNLNCLQRLHRYPTEATRSNDAAVHILTATKLSTVLPLKMIFLMYI